MDAIRPGDVVHAHGSSGSAVVLAVCRDFAWIDSGPGAGRPATVPITMLYRAMGGRASTALESRMEPG